MTHLSMEALLALRERRSEPGNAASWQHVQECAACAAELERLHQRVAQLKALPALRPARDNWPLVAARMKAERQRRRAYQGAGLVGLAMAASLAITVVTRGPEAPAAGTVAQTSRIHQIQEQSRKLEQALSAYQPEQRVLDGPTAATARIVEDRIAQVDKAIEEAERAEQSGQETNVLQLWEEKVGLLDVLVGVQTSRASRVEF